MDNN
jgi:hypothetical protein